MRHALDYSERLVDVGGIVCMLHQQELLLARLRALVKQLDETSEPQDATTFVVLPDCMPDNVTMLTTACLGLPRLLTEDLCRIPLSAQKPYQSIFGAACPVLATSTNTSLSSNSGGHGGSRGLLESGSYRVFGRDAYGYMHYNDFGYQYH